MKKLIVILAILFAACEPQEQERQFKVVTSVDSWITYEVEFPNLPKSEVNPLIVSSFQPSFRYDTTQVITSTSPLTVRVKHYGEQHWIWVKVYEGKNIVAQDSAFGKYKEIWLEYEW
jgi:hypothetical protein